MTTLILKLSGPLITLLFFVLLRALLAPKKKFDDFFVGEEGTYSLSRLQMVLWAYFIISFQVSTIVILLYRNNLNSFNLVFSDEVLWLLGLSLGSYVSVKGITVDRIAKRKTLAAKTKSWSDLITGNNGLDFSRFQMLIWTAIGLMIYAVKCNHYFSGILAVTSTEELAKYFTAPKDESASLLPSIDMSFIVLMGLSQGAYIGKKLVPSFKVEEVKRKLTSEYTEQLSTMDIGIKFKENEVALMKASNKYPAEKIQEMETALASLKQKRDEQNAELEELKKQTDG